MQSKFCNKSVHLLHTLLKRCFTITIFVLLISCNANKNKPDVSNIKVEVTIDRFEQSFFKIDTNNVAAGLAHLRNEYPDFYAGFMQNILQINPMDPQSLTDVKNIIGAYRDMYTEIEKKYNDLGWLKEELTTGFKYVKYYFPNYHLPRVLTYIGTLDAPGIVMTPQYLGIGLHQYAGKNFSVYQAPQVQEIYPAYISRRFDKEYITANCMKAIADDIYPDTSVAKPLMEQMIEKGKQWYMAQHFLPDAPDSVLTGFSQKQLKWVQENEGNVWTYILKNENLYSIEPAVIQTYIGNAPFTQGMPETSPGNIGQWIGMRIVQKYADKNENLSLQQVIRTPAATIFEEAKYKPK